MKRAACLLTSFVLTLSLFSQQDSLSVLKDTIGLDEVIVTGTMVKVSKHSIPLSVTVVNEKRISESEETNILPVLNGRVPGLFITERGVMGFGVSTGAAGQISLRGIGGSPTTGVLMLIDGHPQFMGIFGHPLPDSYASSDVERVEVIRGPASILYGSNAMGGVINIITKKQEEEGLHGNAHLMYGSYNTQKYMASAGYKKRGFTAYASLNHDRTDGHRDNSQFSITNGYMKLGYRFSSNLDISADLSLAGFEASDPGPDTINALPGNSLDISRGYWALTFNNAYEKYSGTVKLFYNFGEHRISDGFHSHDRNYGVNIFETARLFRGNSLAIGVDYLAYGGKADNETYDTFITDTSVYDGGVYGYMQQELFDKLTLNAGLRLQQHSTYGTEWIPAGGLAWKISGNTTWKASVAKGFRSPTIRELFVWNHNITLNPETIMNYETGFLQSFFSKKLNIELTAFMVTGKNMIINVPMQGLQNAGEVSNKGIEMAAEVNPSDRIMLNMTYSYTHMRSPVYATPEHNIFSSISYRFKKIGFMVSAQYINNLDSDPAVNNVEYETYTLLNSKITWQPVKFGELFISAENMLNQKYATNIYYTMPGITAFGGFKLKF